MNDLRTPIGLFFLLLGLILVIMPSAGAPLTDLPVNLYTGLVALAFGGLMFALGRRVGRRPH